MSRRSIDSRMDRIMARLLPPGSVARREYELSPELRERLDYHRSKTAAIISRAAKCGGPGSAYERWIEGELYLPDMPSELTEALGLRDPLAGIGPDATAEELAEIYSRMIGDDQ